MIKGNTDRLSKIAHTILDTLVEPETLYHCKTFPHAIRLHLITTTMLPSVRYISVVYMIRYTQPLSRPPLPGPGGNETAPGRSLRLLLGLPLGRSGHAFFSLLRRGHLPRLADDRRRS